MHQKIQYLKNMLFIGTVCLAVLTFKGRQLLWCGGWAGCCPFLSPRLFGQSSSRASVFFFQLIYCPKHRTPNARTSNQTWPRPTSPKPACQSRCQTWHKPARRSTLVALVSIPSAVTAVPPHLVRSGRVYRTEVLHSGYGRLPQWSHESHILRKQALRQYTKICRSPRCAYSMLLPPATRKLWIRIGSAYDFNRSERLLVFSVRKSVAFEI